MAALGVNRQLEQVFVSGVWKVRAHQKVDGPELSSLAHKIQDLVQGFGAEGGEQLRTQEYVFVFVNQGVGVDVLKAALTELGKESM